MTTLVVAEQDDGRLSPATARAVTAAAALGAPVDVLVAGAGIGAAAAAAATLAGVRRVLAIDDPALAGGLAETAAAQVLALAGDYDAFVAAATTRGKATMPRIAARLGVMQVSDVVAVIAADTFERPVYAGSAVETVRTTAAKRVLTVRAAAFAAAGPAAAAPVVAVAPAPVPGRPAQLVRRSVADGERPDLGAARVVVSGGRGLQSPENFRALVLPLAGCLGAAVGASRAAVDAGFAPNDWQVGQTGRIVAPELYVAAGISGAIQHLAGMKDSKVIVAINRDAEAPIFSVADYGLVADLFEALPAVTRALEKGA
ncbi:FAD-binding protein [Pseudoxanthobacter sp.]|uniref:electron transfer flavoprotein subunit alpha/FixB family protein n=1 Tax=Pseudoxanthobacter sp. TaxID=1925742 RepID=UPI002FE380AE